MRNKNIYFQLSLLIYLVYLFSSCSRIELSQENYYGNFTFKVIKEHKILGASTTYDTIYYDGIIRKFTKVDSKNDLCIWDNSFEDSLEKITIEFLDSTIITSNMNSKGELIAMSGNHYHHEGKFVDPSTINFKVLGLGGLAQVWNYDVSGIRK